MKTKSLCKLVVAIIFGFFLGALCLYLLKIDAINAYNKLIKTIFGDTKSIVNSIIYSAPFLLTALSFCVSYKGGIFNVGIEGGFIISSIASCAVGILFPSYPSFILIPLAVLTGIFAAIIYNYIIFELNNQFNINYIFSMIIFNYIALYVSNFIVNINGIKSISGAETTKRISENAMMSMPLSFTQKFSLPPNTNITFIVAVIIAIIVDLMFKYSPIGHDIENIRYNKEASILSGINVKRTTYLTYLYSAIIVGFAGSMYVLSISKRVSVLPTFENYGNTGVLIALFSNSNPIFTIFSSLFFGALKYAGRSLNIVNAPSQVIDLIISSIILIAATNFFINKKNKRGNK